MSFVINLDWAGLTASFAFAGHVQHFDGLPPYRLGPSVIFRGLVLRRVAHELLDRHAVYLCIPQITRERPAKIVSGDGLR